MTNLTTIDLEKFTAVGDARPHLTAPWRAGGKLYATNGQSMVEIDDDGRQAVDASKDHPDCGSLFGMRTHGEFFTLPELAPKVPCKVCRGKGWCYSETCDDCDGKGEFMHGTFEYECKRCDGEGHFYFASAPEGEPESRCPASRGLGEEINSHNPGATTTLGNLTFATRLLRMLLPLPGIKVACCDGAPPYASLWFEFDGGRGLVMAIRK